MTVGDVSLLVIAVVLVVAATFGILTMVKVGRTMDVARKAIEETHRDSGPVLRKADTTLGLVNSNLRNLTGVTGAARSITGNAAGLVSLLVATLGAPLVRIAGFTYGVRRALSARSARAARRAVKRAGRRFR